MSASRSDSAHAAVREMSRSALWAGSTLAWRRVSIGFPVRGFPQYSRSARFMMIGYLHRFIRIKRLTRPECVARLAASIETG